MRFHLWVLALVFVAGCATGDGSTSKSGRPSVFKHLSEKSSWKAQAGQTIRHIGGQDGLDALKSSIRHLGGGEDASALVRDSRLIFWTPFTLEGLESTLLHLR